MAGSSSIPPQSLHCSKDSPYLLQKSKKNVEAGVTEHILRPELALSALTGSHPGPTQLLRIWSQVKVGNKWKAEKQYKKRNGMLCFGQLLQISRSKPGVGKRSIVTLHNSNLLKASSAHTCSKVPAPVREFLL